MHYILRHFCRTSQYSSGLLRVLVRTLMLGREKVRGILAAWWQQVLPEENKGVRGVGSVVAVGAAETVCVLHAGVPGCVKRFSLVRKHRQHMIETNSAAAACTLDRYPLAVCSVFPVSPFAGLSVRRQT